MRRIKDFGLQIADCRFWISAPIAAIRCGLKLPRKPASRADWDGIPRKDAKTQPSFHYGGQAQRNARVFFSLSPSPLVPLSLKESDKSSIGAAVPFQSSRYELKNKKMNA